MAKTVRDGLQRLDQGLPPSQPASWLVLVGISIAWVMVAGKQLAGGQFPSDAVLVYSFYFLLPLTLDDELKHKLLKGTLSEYAGKLAFGLLSMIMVYAVLFRVILPSEPPSIAYSSVFPIFLFQAVVVTPVEELFFRAWLPHRMERRGYQTATIYGAVTIGSVLNAFVFASFHLGAYGTDSIAPYVILGVLSGVWLWVSRLEMSVPFTSKPAPLGIAVTIGMHLGWNLCVLGILFGRVIVGA